MSKEEKRSFIFCTGIIIILVLLGVYVIKLCQKEAEMNEQIEYIQEREVLGGEYVNTDDGDYVVLQVQYDDYSKLERYLIDEIVFKDIENVDVPFLKIYFNRNERILKNELYY